jgi:hypothetical protein
VVELLNKSAADHGLAAASLAFRVPTF